MKTFKNIITFLCSILFVISGVVTLFAYTIEYTAFNATNYKRAFEKQNLYERAPEILAGALDASNTKDPNADPILKTLAVDEWKTIISTLLPSEKIKALINNALDSTFNYLNGATNSAEVSLLPVKESLSGSQGVEMMKRLIRSQPDCTDAQLQQIDQGEFALCNVPNEKMDTLIPLIESQLKTLMLDFPDRFILIPPAQSNTVDDPRIKINQARAIMKGTFIAPLLFLFLITVVGVRTLPEWLKRWGWLLIVTGIISVILALTGPSLLGWGIQRIFQNQEFSFFPPILFSAITEIVHAVAVEIFKPVVIEALVLTIAGLGMLIGDLYIADKDELI